MTTRATRTTIGDGALGDLRSALAGAVIAPGDADYEDARRVWNGSIDRRPALVARCTSVEDVVEAVRFAASERLPTAVRGGAHNVAGHGTCDDGIVIDLSPLRSVAVDPAARVARVGGGALWRDVDAATQPHGLATPGGVISSTGVGGLTLGGGVGWLARPYGLSCDNLIAAEVVCADGRVVRASESENTDLLWALRGGGGNFGVVTTFELALHPVGDVLGGGILYPLEQARDVLRGFREVAPELPEELMTVLVFLTVPPAPDFPPELHGRRGLSVGVCHVGDPEAGERAIAPLRALGTPLLERVAVMPYARRQQLQDASAPAGLGHYWKSDYLAGLPDGVVDALVASAARTTSPRSMLHVYHLGGAVARRGEDHAAYAHRSAPYLLSILGVWDDPASDPAPHAEWARELWSELRPFAAGAYVNFLADEGADRVREAYGDARYARLAAVKARFDPTNMFRLNQNIRPAAG